MTRLLPASLILLLAFSACEGNRLPVGYRDIRVPEGRLASPPARDTGRALFLQHCALCHGERADGRGVRRSNLSSRPQNFTDPAWRKRSSPRWIYYVIREGTPGTAMAGWKILTPDETWDLVAYLLSVADGPPPGLAATDS